MVSNSALLSVSLFVGTVFLGAALPAQTEVYWQASRMSKELHRVNACGEVDLTVDLSTNNFPANTAPSLRSAHLAPDGQVWVVNFIVPHFTLLDGDGTNIRNIAVVSGGRPFSIEFDRNGNAYVTMPGTGVEVYDPNGQFVKAFPMTTGNPLGISEDSDGNMWVAHRMGPPSMITKIDVAAGTATDFPFPGGTSTLGGQVVADFQGLLQKSTVWCIGDSSSELVHFDNAGQHLGTYIVDPNSTTISAMTIDKNNNIWIGNFRNPNIFYFDTTQLRVTRTLQSPPNVLGLAMDGRGRLLATARVSFSGPAPSVVRRFNTTTFVEEQVTEVGLGAGSAASSNFHSALVGNPFADFDGDQTDNFSEITVLNSSAFDAQSNADTNIIVSGPNSRGGNLDIGIEGKPGATALLGVGLQKLATPICLPAWTGCLLIDPSALAIILNATVPASLPATVPSNASLIGTAVYLQALYDLGAATKPAWSNLDCVVIYQ